MHGEFGVSEKGVTEMEHDPCSRSLSAATHVSFNATNGWLRWAVSAAFIALLLACDGNGIDECSADLIQANAPICDVSSPFCREQLLRRAKCGDWKAAADFGWHRALKEGRADPETIMLLRQWYAHDKRAWFSLAYALSGSCSAAERSEAIQFYEAYEGSREFAQASDVKKRDTERQLQRLKDARDKGLVPIGCGRSNADVPAQQPDSQ